MVRAGGETDRERQAAAECEMRFWVGLGLVLAIAGGTMAKDLRPKPMHAGLAAFITEALTCNAYFGFAEAVVRRQAGGDKGRAQKLAGRLAQLAGRALDLAITSGQRIELSPDEITAQHGAIIADLKQQTNNAAGALPKLIGQYDAACKALIRKPEDRVEALVKKQYE